MPWTPCKLLVGVGLLVLVGVGCGEQQEPTPPPKPVVVRKKIEAPKPPPVQAVKPAEQEAPGPVTAEAPPQPEVVEKPPMEQAKVEPPPVEAKPAAPEAKPAAPEAEPAAPEETVAEGPAPIPGEPAKEVVYIYDPKGKIDPFRSVFVVQKQGRPGTRIKIDAREERKIPLTPLQKVDLSQLKVVGIIISPAGNKALVEDPEGKGYVITKGTYIGSNFGQVTKILKDRVVVEEQVEDFFTGQMKLQSVDLLLQKKLGA